MPSPLAVTLRALTPGYLKRCPDAPQQHVSLRLFLAEGFLYGGTSAYVNTFLPLFALALGASPSDVAMMSAINHLVGPLTYLAGGYIAERSYRHKRIYVVLEGLLGRGVVLLYVLVPIWLHGQAAVWAVIMLHLVRMTFFRLAGPAKTAVTGRIVPQPLRGRFMSVRGLASSLGELSMQPLAGLIVASFVFPRGYQYGFALAWAVGMAGTAVFARIPVPQHHEDVLPRPRDSLNGFWQDVRSDRRLRAFLIVVLVWGLGEHAVGPFTSVHMVRNLKLGAQAIGLLAGSASLASLVGLPLIGWLSDRYSNRMAVVVSGIALALTYSLWLWARTAWQLIPVFLLSGFISRGFLATMLNLLLAIAPAARYARYGALYQAVETVATVVAPLVGGYLFEHPGFSGNLVLVIVLELAAMALAWRFVRDRAPASATAGSC